MSDFFGDDFTAELKGYFLDQFVAEIVNYLESSDEGSWTVFRDEILEKSLDWQVDAKTNEFIFFAGWFTTAIEQLTSCENFSDYEKILEQTQAYLQLLSAQKKDSDEFPSRFAIKESAGQVGIYLFCKIGGQEVVLPVHHVVEVIGRKPLFALPLPDPAFAGMMPYRGEAIPVFNLESYGFQINAAHENTYFVVCDVGPERFAFQVTKADLLLEISSKELQGPSHDGGLISAPFISHFVIRENKNILVFDLEELVAA